MTQHPNETLDESIDRIASGLTSAPADPALVARIADCVNAAEPRRVEWWRLAMPAMGVAVVAIFAFVMMPGERTSPQPSPAVAAPIPPAPNVAAPVAPAVEPVVQRASVPPRRRERSTPFEPQIPQIEALSSPALLAVDSITADQLTIAPVDVASLDLANLALTDADTRDVPKE